MMDFQKVIIFGIKYSKKYLNNEYIWILNNDVTIDKNTIFRFVEFSEKDENKNFLGGTIVEYYSKDKIQCTCGGKYNMFTTISKNENEGKPLKNLLKLNENSDYISGCSIFGNIKLFDMVSNFSEDYLLYFEELDLMKKAKKNNIGKKWVKNAIIYHKEGASIGSENVKRKKSELSEYYSNKSCLIYSRKFYPYIFYIIAFNRFFLKSLKFFLNGEKEYKKVLKESYKSFFKEIKK